MKIIVSFIGLIAVLALLIALALMLGGPKDIAPLESVNAPFKGLDYKSMPGSLRYPARDGLALAYRAYKPQGEAPFVASVVLVHGSSARSDSMHFMAESFARAGFAVYTLDMRGHGDSGTRGQLAYIGQLEDDVEDFMKAVKPQGKVTLAGFSSGGGFALRFAAGARQALFSNYLLLAPFIHQAAPNNKPESTGWGSIGIPRYVAITLLNGMGVTVFNHLPVMRFALNEEIKSFLTPAYSFALAQNFRPHNDYLADIRDAKQPMTLVVGTEDELFYADRYQAVFKQAQREIPISLVPREGHISLSLSPAAHQAAITAVRRLNSLQ